MIFTKHSSEYIYAWQKKKQNKTKEKNPLKIIVIIQSGTGFKISKTK